MTVAVVTPWHNHPELWPDYADAIERGPEPDELIVIDNGSAPPLPAKVATIRNETNVGFTRACNQGLREATADVVVFLNNDIRCSRSGWLESLVSWVEPGVLCGAKMRRDRHADVDGVAYPYLDGWCLAGTRDDLVELGGFDVSLREPAYYSDNLLCLNARAQGMSLREVPVGLMHKLGQTSNDDAVARTAAAEWNRGYYQIAAREIGSYVVT